MYTFLPVRQYVHITLIIYCILAYSRIIFCIIAYPLGNIYCIFGANIIALSHIYPKTFVHIAYWDPPQGPYACTAAKCI